MQMQLQIGSRVLSVNGDGLEDWAGVILREKSDGLRTSQLYVLLQQPQGSYRVAEKSLEEQIAGMGCCWTEDLTISRSSIYIQNNAKTAATNGSSDTSIQVL